MGFLTLDTGALIALESRRKRITKIVEVARQCDHTILVPMNAVAEWWRGGRLQEELLASFTPITVTERIARVAGEALAALYGRQDRLSALTTIDATVMATAALHGANQEGAPLYTGDLDDLTLFAAFFPNVRLFSF
jgi:hypothetical protein